MSDIFEYLNNNTYPGRGILVGKYADEIVIAYFIMGRSENSRNRVFRKKDDVLYTKAYDESKLKDPSLIIYNAIREYKTKIIVTNGDQTDTIFEYLADDKDLKQALATREYEPDAPNYTPRISALIDGNSYQISILKKENEACARIFYDYEFIDGKAHFISTYDHDGDPLPAFSSAPLEFSIEDDFEGFGQKLWDSLNKDNRVSLYVRFGGKEKIFNRNEGD
ncbi:MAG: IMP cyclohydrolase [Erysipelotrichaceae bacterium]|nr:IMP cyclohydrolase [Erysipelotrichaceae bacterium]